MNEYRNSWYCDNCKKQWFIDYMDKCPVCKKRIQILREVRECKNIQ